jgi:hypothetical protein
MGSGPVVAHTRRWMRYVYDNCAVSGRRHAVNKSGLEFEAGVWLPGMDSNHDSRLQRPLSYH